MKNLSIIFVVAFLAFSLNLTANTCTTIPETNACNPNSWFKYPQKNTSIKQGQPLYVRIDPQNYRHIQYIDLFVNGKHVRRESQYPFEWTKGSGGGDYSLRNLRPGTYKLMARIKDNCGKFHEIQRVVFVRANTPQAPNKCGYSVDYKYPQKGEVFYYGSDVYVRIKTSDYQRIKYIDLFINGKFVRKEINYPYEWCKGSGNSDGYLRNLNRGTYQLKARVFDKCGGVREIKRTFYVR